MGNIPDLIKKLKALTDRGVGGEKVTAGKMLHKLMAQHGLTMEDLEDVEKREVRYFRIKKDLRRLFTQICYSITGSHTEWTHRNKRGQIGHECTPAEAMEIQIKWDVYSKLYRNEEKIFYRAFLIKNEIFHPEKSVSGDELTPEQLEEYRRAARMSEDIQRGQIHKRINQ